MRHKTRVVGSIAVAILSLSILATVGVTRYPCGLHYQCKTTAYGIQLTYPYSWKELQSRTPSTENKLGIRVMGPDKNTLVGIIPPYTISAQNSVAGEQSYYEPISVRSVANFPNSLDVQLIDKIIIPGYPITYSAVESFITKTQYKQLNLGINTYRLLLGAQQEFMIQPRSSDDTKILFMVVSQKQFSSEQATKAWFTQSAAQTAHTILLSAQQAHGDSFTS
jgi:hypothetical protein